MHRSERSEHHDRGQTAPDRARSTRWVKPEPEPRLPGTALGTPIEATLRVGVVVDSEHVQALVEIRNAATNELLAMGSWPHRGLADWRQLMVEAVGWLVDGLEAHAEPFPD